MPTLYKFSGKELDDETGYSYFGARYYDPNISIWLSVDPLSDKYPGLSPYNYCANNPIMLYDPDGTWIPGLDDEGNATYTAEKGDTYETFKDQYGLTDKQASMMLDPKSKVRAGETTITGAQAKEATGSEVLRVNVTSPDVKDDDINRQMAFAINRENKKGNSEASVHNYFSNLKVAYRGRAGGSSWGISTDPKKPTRVTILGEEMNINLGIGGSNDGRFSTFPNGWPSRTLHNEDEAFDFLHPNAYPTNPYKSRPGLQSIAVPVITIWNRR